MITILFICLVLFILGGMSVAIALGASSIFAIIFSEVTLDLVIIPQRVIGSLARSWALLAIPMFVMLGEIFDKAGISDKLIDVANIFFGPVTGALGIVNIVVSFFFGGISGSASADTAAIGGVMIPAMKNAGYDSEFSTVVTITSSTLGPIVPPSVLMILFSWVTEIPLGRLFLAGYLPGFTLMLGLIILTYFISKKRNYPTHKRPSFKKGLVSIFYSIPALLTPFIIVFGIVLGIMTAVESSVVALVYSIFISVFIYRSLKLSDVKEIMYNTAKVTANIGLLLAFAAAFSYIITYSRLPYEVAQGLSALDFHPVVFMVVNTLLFLLLGTFLNPGAIVLMAVPILFPGALALGIDPIHYTLVSALAMCVGHVTPPVGLCLFVGCSISGDKIEQLVKPLVPYVLTMLLVIFIIILFPEIVLFLPGLF